MATVYSKLFAVVHALAGDSSAYSVPDGYRWIIRDISIYNGNLAEVVNASVTTVDATNLAVANADDNVGQWYFHEEGRWVIPDGEFFQLHATFACDFVISGYELVLP